MDLNRLGEIRAIEPVGDAVEGAHDALEQRAAELHESVREAWRDAAAQAGLSQRPAQLHRAVKEAWSTGQDAVRDGGRVVESSVHDGGYLAGRAGLGAAGLGADAADGVKAVVDHLRDEDTPMSAGIGHRQIDTMRAALDEHFAPDQALQSAGDGAEQVGRSAAELGLAATATGAIAGPAVLALGLGEMGSSIERAEADGVLTNGEFARAAGAGTLSAAVVGAGSVLGAVARDAKAAALVAKDSDDAASALGRAAEGALSSGDEFSSSAGRGLRDVAKGATEATEAASAPRIRVGTYRDLKQEVVEGYERHHIPSKEALRRLGLSPDEGFCILLPAEIHRRTGSWGNSLTAQAFRREEVEAAQSGGLVAAAKLGVDDLASLLQPEDLAEYVPSLTELLVLSVTKGMA